jgi:hypothetical protein
MCHKLWGRIAPESARIISCLADLCSRTMPSMSPLCHLVSNFALGISMPAPALVTRKTP